MPARFDHQNADWMQAFNGVFFRTGEAGIASFNFHGAAQMLPAGRVALRPENKGDTDCHRVVRFLVRQDF